MGDDVGLLRCRNCRFWQNGGNVCRRSAPRTTDRPHVVSRWPETRADDGCGDGSRRTGGGQGQEFAPPVTGCASCAFWDRPGQGIDPAQRGDHLFAWWREAGYCRRHAPQPGSEIGYQAFWRATHRSDFCFEGRPA